MGNPGGNALNNNIENALNNNIENITILNDEKIKENSSKKKNDELLERFLPISKRLAEINQPKISQTISTQRIKNDTKSFIQLYKNGVSISRIKQVMEFYAGQTDNEFAFVCLCGASFRKKFDNMEKSMERASKTTSKQTPPKVNEDPVDETRRKIKVSNEGLPEHVHHLPFNHPERLKYMDLSKLEKFDPSKTNWTDDPNA